MRPLWLSIFIFTLKVKFLYFIIFWDKYTKYCSTILSILTLKNVYALCHDKGQQATRSQASQSDPKSWNWLSTLRLFRVIPDWRSVNFQAKERNRQESHSLHSSCQIWARPLILSPFSDAQGVSDALTPRSMRGRALGWLHPFTWVLWDWRRSPDFQSISTRKVRHWQRGLKIIG